MNSDLESTPMPLEPVSVTSADFNRLERKVDKMADALQQLVRVEERQTNQGVRIGETEKELVTLATKIDAIDKKVDQWINRGIGVWAVAVTLWAVFEFATSHGMILLGGK